MTMPALLSHFGMNDVRFVAAGGQIVFDGVTSLANGAFTHPVHGSVTAVAQHTFHGGEEEPDAGALDMTAWWEDEAAIGRHVASMEHAFPQFTYLPASDDRSPCWWGEIDTGRGRFKVVIILRRDGGLPFVSVLNRRLGVQSGRRWERPPHVYLNGDLCVASSEDWQPDEHTAATATAWAAHWLAAYTEWRFRREWPAEGVHAVAS